MSLRVYSDSWFKRLKDWNSLGRVASSPESAARRKSHLFLRIDLGSVREGDSEDRLSSISLQTSQPLAGRSGRRGCGELAPGSGLWQVQVQRSARLRLFSFESAVKVGLGAVL